MFYRGVCVFNFKIYLIITRIASLNTWHLRDVLNTKYFVSNYLWYDIIVLEKQTTKGVILKDEFQNFEVAYKRR